MLCVVLCIPTPLLLEVWCTVLPHFCHSSIHERVYKFTSRLENSPPKIVTERIYELLLFQGILLEQF